MSKHVPLIVVAVFLLVTAGAIYLGVRHANDASDNNETPGPPPALTKAVQPAPGQPTPTGMSLEGAKIEQRDPQGALEWTVTAHGDLEFDKDSQTVTGRNVRFEMTDKAQMPCLLDAPVFRADYDAKVLTFDEGVTGRMTSNSAAFRVNHLVFTFSTQKLVGSGGVRFSQGQYLATAQNIVVDPKAKKVRLSGGVRFEKRR